MPQSLRLGVLGCGSITRHVHLKILARLPDVQVTVPSGFVPGLYALSAVADADNAIPELGASHGATANGRVATRAVSVLAP